MKTGPGRSMMALALLCAAWPMAGATAQEIFGKEDDSDGSIFYSTDQRSGNIGGDPLLSTRNVTFEFCAIKPPQVADHPYVLMVHTNTPDWIAIGPGPSLVLTLDGKQTLPLGGEGSVASREVVNPGNMAETASYALTPLELKLISTSKSIEFRLIGDRQTITGTWGTDLIGDAGAFVSQGPELLGLNTTPNSPAPNAAAPGAPAPSTLAPDAPHS